MYIKDNYKHPTKRNGMNEKPQPHFIHEAVLIGDWEEVPAGTDAQTIKPELAPEKLDGLILKGYEMKWGKTNENGEQYDTTAFDDFIQSYFVDGKLNMPVDINHEGYYNWQAYCGRVLYIETNSVGFYFAVYVPRTYAHYNELLWGLKNGILQGFSKEGYVSWGDSEYKWKEDGSFDYELVHRMKVTSVSIVTTPANGLLFERMQETKQNALRFFNNTKEQEKTLEREDF